MARGDLRLAESPGRAIEGCRSLARRHGRVDFHYHAMPLVIIWSETQNGQASAVDVSGLIEKAALSAPFSYRANPAVPRFPDDKPLLVFDGDCVLCSGSARFVMRHDPLGLLRLTAAQSRLGQALYKHYGLDPANYDTFLLLDDGRVFQKSDAAIRVARRLGFPWSAAAVLQPVPGALRDAAYDIVARNRYRLFGRRATCFVPGPDQRGRFV